MVFACQYGTTLIFKLTININYSPFSSGMVIMCPCYKFSSFK